MNYLIDHNLKGQAVLIWGIITTEGWLNLVSIRFITFEEVGMPTDSSDRQSHQRLLHQACVV